MSHFSKIKTNISRLEVLKTTLKNLGFVYQLNEDLDANSHFLSVYKENTKNPSFFFKCEGNEYILIADVSTWNLNVSSEHFLEKLHKGYAISAITHYGTSNGFNVDEEISMTDGSTKLILRKWCY
uniref:Uncharacterized protein ycf35 n=1 Tax=Platysiphonia delicata TaxID=2006979 RepID=A0A1Z1M0V5_9FLOR|nr:hypothetical protein [Platysiphonia delicata]ARW59512.1 hypothetical protein [Platysiphonia delicata]